jgi:hypothetical protein
MSFLSSTRTSRGKTIYLSTSNSNIPSIHISLRDEKIENICYRRIFKNIDKMKNPEHYRVAGRTEFRNEGRLTCHAIHGVRSENRQRLQINGDPTVEVDVSACFPSIAFHLLGLESPNDLYSAEFSDLCVNDLGAGKSTAIKSLVQFLLNTWLRDESFKIKDDLRSKLIRNVAGSLVAYESGGSYEKGQIPVLGLTKSNAISLARKLVEQALERFSALGPEWICRASWLRLMNVESNMAVALHLRAVEADICLLSVHDSFLVQERHEQWLAANLAECYREAIAGELGCRPEELASFVRPKLKRVDKPTPDSRPESALVAIKTAE